MRINNNITALNVNNKLATNVFNTSKSVEKLSSGLRINRSSDDAAGLAISEKMRAQVRGLNQATKNAQDGISLLQTAEGAMNETSAILQRMRELTVQAANDVLVSQDRAIIKVEINKLTDEINRIADQTEFNTLKLLGGSTAIDYTAGTGATATEAYGFSSKATTVLGGADAAGGGEKYFQVGANADQSMQITIEPLSSGHLFRSGRSDDLESTIEVNSHTIATKSIEVLDYAIDYVNNARASVGAFINRLENVINVNTSSSENTQAAESRIRDVDMAKEMMNFTKNNILSQAAQAMLSQANQLPQGVLQLLR